MTKTIDRAISLIHIDRVVLKNSYEDRTFVEINYFENSGVWQVTDVHGGWCGTYLFNPKVKQHKIKVFKRWVHERNIIRQINLKR